MNLQTFFFLLLSTVVLFVLFRTKKKTKRPKRTERIGIVFHKEKPKNMAAPTSTGTVNNGSPLFATVQALQANGSNSNGVVSNISVTLSDTTVTLANVLTSVSGVPFIEFDPIKPGTTTATVTCTVTDPIFGAQTLTAVATVTVIPGPNDVLTTAIEVLFSTTQPA